MDNGFNGFHYVRNTNDLSILILDIEQYNVWLSNDAQDFTRKYLQAIQYNPETKVPLFIPSLSGGVSNIIFPIDKNDCWALSSLYDFLPSGSYDLYDHHSIITSELFYIAFALGFYHFDRYKEVKGKEVSLFLPAKFNTIIEYINAHCLVRDLINTPAEDMGPQELSNELKALSANFSATYTEIVGESLLVENYPAIHAVGRASNRSPRLAELTWGDIDHPVVSLVGKGVCFDSGGLDIKSAAGMLIMHKDMGGAAHVIGLAYLIMSYNLPIRLRVLIPCVENLINEDSLKPSDVITMRNGLTVQVKNTDAEGRLILADALFKAQAESPDLMIDFATLTGAMRVALGADIPGFFSTNKEVATDLQELSSLVGDLVWNMPLFSGYNSDILGSISNYSNVSQSGFGGAITAALFLQKFVGDSEWVHFDLMGWNHKSRPGRPIGGEAMGLMTVITYLKQRYSRKS